MYLYILDNFAKCWSECNCRSIHQPVFWGWFFLERGGALVISSFSWFSSVFQKKMLKIYQEKLIYLFVVQRVCGQNRYIAPSCAHCQKINLITTKKCRILLDFYLYKLFIGKWNVIACIRYMYLLFHIVLGSNTAFFTM